MNLPSYSVRYLIKILSYAKGGMEITKEEATKGLGFLSPRKASPKAKATRARKRADDAKERAERAEASRKLRAEVFARPGFDCEMGAHNGMNDYMQLCHLIAGPAKRALQRVWNCVRGCIYCHGRWHNIGPEEFRENILDLCAANNYPVPPVFLREPRAPLRAPKPNPGQTHYQGDSCPGGHLVEVDPPAPQAPESLPERIAK